MNASLSSSSATALDGAVTDSHRQRLLWAGFMAILAAGVGFSIRAGILGQWAEQYGFTQTELGAITGGGLTGFGIIILLSSLIADRIGFGKLMFAAFIMHLISAALTLATGAGIPIEQRGAAEVLVPLGVRVAPDGAEAFNPAFDVTPARLIRAIITEHGVIDPVTPAQVARLVRPR